MKHKHIQKVITLVLAVALLISVVPTTVFASIPNWETANVVYEGSTFGTNGYYNVISQKQWTLVPGAATETEMVINNAAGTRRQVMHIIEVDPSNPDVSIVPGYYNIDKDLSDVNNQKAAGVTDVAKYYANELGYNVVAAMNTDLYYEANAPRVLIYNGQDLRSGRTTQSVLCVYKDANDIVSVDVKPYKKAEIDNELANGHATRGALIQAVSVSFGMTVNDGQLVKATEERTSSSAARSMVGVKEDGTLVLVMNDGRNANNSVGFNDYELGESMLALGCKWAANCDGGGSSSIVTKRAGEDTTTIRCVPCDGAERPTIHSVMVVSNVGPTGELNNVNITGDYDYFAPGTTYTFGAEAIDTHGYAMDMPEAKWMLSDASFGTVNDGTFTSSGTTGDVDVLVTSSSYEPVSDRTVIFSNNKGFNNVKIYCWNSESDSAVGPAWPGSDMTYYDINEHNETRYSFEIPEGADSFIVHNGEGWQSNNVAFTGKTGVYLDDNNNAQFFDITGEVYGSKTIHVTNPTALSLKAAETTLPYSTPEKVRTITLPMSAMIGEAEVYTSGAYDITVSPENGGSVKGLSFTATDDMSVSKAVVSIKYLPTDEEFTYTVNYGKGSEVLWDFEDGDISDWVSTTVADQMMRDHGCALKAYGDFTTPFTTLAAGGQISWSINTTTALSSVAEGGKAHGGDKALAVTFDMKSTEFNSWVYSIIWNMRGNLVLRDVANGNNATAFGCWVYIPKGFYTAKNNGANALQLTVQKGPDADTLSGTQLNLQYNGKNINALKESDIPENRWVYVKADLTANNYVKLVDPYNDVYRSPSFIRMYVKPSEAQELTYYFDDWTLDYSSAVDDREPPVVSNATYCTNDTNIEFDNQTINTNIVSFDANIADKVASNAEGLDYSSAKIYVDGVAVSGVKASGSSMGVQNVTLSNGYHKITFEVADNLGNATTLTKALTVDADAAKAAVRLSGHNDKNNAIEAGSVYYVDVIADAAEQIKSVTTTIDLQSAHEWELDHMIVADGFTASYELDPIKDNVATITITNNGSNLAGEQTLVSLPARVWSFNEGCWVGGDGAAPVHMTAAQRYASTYGEPVLLMEANVTYGEVTYTDNSAGTFGGGISEATEVTGNKLKVWHEHNAEPIEDKAPTCTEDGFSGRTYCEECGSVVDWGTTVPATGHSYELDGDYYVCSDCHEVYNVTGLFEMNGELHYAINGKIMSGWQQVDDDWYYFRSSTKKAAEGTVHFNYGGGVEFDMNFDNGRLLSGVWVEAPKGTRYYYSGSCYAHTWATIDGERYYFDENANVIKGYYIIKDSRYSHDDDYQMYHFDETTGKLIEKMSSTGLLVTDDATYYLENGYAKNGLYRVDGYYYYFKLDHTAATGRHYVQYPNGLMAEGYYDFDENGRMIIKNGIFNENGTLYYYENNVKTYAGLIEIDGDLYYVHSSGKVATGYTWVTKTNELATDQGYYMFGEDGKMLTNGIYELDGELYYFEDGQKTYAGLITIDNDLYYVHSSGKVATGYTWVTKINELATDQGYYMFGEDGKMLTNGIYEIDGELYYLQNGRKFYAGLITIGNDLYYVHSSGKVATGYTWVTKINELATDQGYYMFGEDGKMLTNGIYEIDGELYYLQNGRKFYAGLIEIDGDLYYVHSSGKVATGYTWVTMTNGYCMDKQDYYLFDATGKMVGTGIYELDNELYYFQDGRKFYAGLIEIDNDLYYANSSGKIAVGQYWVTKTNNILPAGYYMFDTDGKMIVEK